MADIVEGDVVQLKSGGPQMTVDEVDTELDVVTCSWFDSDHKVHTKGFGIKSLKKAQPRAIGVTSTSPQR